jgi:hypothetical protein
MEAACLHFSSNIIRLIGSRKMRWAGHAERMREGGRGEVRTGSCWGKRSEEDYLEDLGVCGRIILKWIFKK